MKTIAIDQLKKDLEIVLSKIGRLKTQQNGGYTAEVAKSFHLGMVGGSRRNVSSLNNRRASELDRTIDRAILLNGLYKEHNALEAKITDLENNGPEKRAAKKILVNQGLVQYWNNLKAGDTIDHGNGPLIITKKNKKSLETGICKWTAAEIIGREAAALI